MLSGPGAPIESLTTRPPARTGTCSITLCLSAQEPTPWERYETATHPVPAPPWSPAAAAQRARAHSQHHSYVRVVEQVLLVSARWVRHNASTFLAEKIFLHSLQLVVGVKGSVGSVIPGESVHSTAEAFPLFPGRAQRQPLPRVFVAVLAAYSAGFQRRARPHAQGLRNAALP